MGQLGDNFFRNYNIEGDPIVEAIEALQRDVENLNGIVDGLQGQVTDLDLILGQFKTETNNRLNTVVRQIDKLFSGDYTFVKWHGAVGDGVTDDTAAIQAALDAGKTYVIFDKGTYLVSGERYTGCCLIPSNRHLIGLGATIVNKSNETSAFINHSPYLEDPTAGTGYSANKNIIIQGLNFESENIYALGFIAFARCDDIKIIDCNFSSIGGWHFIEISSSINVIISGCRFYNYTGQYVTEMIQIDICNNDASFPFFGPYNDTPPLNIVIDSCSFENPYEYYSDASRDFAVVPAAIGSHNGSGTAGLNAQYLKITNCDFKCLQTCLKFWALRNSIIKGNTASTVRRFFAENSLSDTANRFAGLIFTENIYNADFLSSEVAIPNLWQLPRCISFYGTNCVISNNELYGGNGHCLALNGSNYTVTGNKITAAGRNGIYLFCADGSTVDSNNVTDCAHFESGGDADIVIRSNEGDAANACNITGNLAGKIICDNSGAAKTLVTNNNILTSLTKTAGDGCVVHNNLINGSWNT